MNRPKILFIGGRSGVGKSTVAFALHDLLASKDVTHAVIEGDALDLAHPSPWRQRMAERNLAAVWSNYRDDGYHRLIYTNTVSVLEVDELAAAVGGDPDVTSVLLQATDATAKYRLERREHGDSLREHIERSTKAASFLEKKAAPSVHRIPTDGRTPEEIALVLADLTGWEAS